MISTQIKSISQNNEVKFYKSISEASKELNINRTNISAVLSGRNKTAKGYKFENLKPNEMTFSSKEIEIFYSFLKKIV